MAIDFNGLSPDKKKSDLLLAAGFTLLALVVYALSMSGNVYPGEAARLMATYSGLDTLNLPLYPIWGKIVGWLSNVRIATLPLRLNFFSALCMAVSTGLFYRLVSFVVYELIHEENSADHAPRASMIAGAVAAIAFLFAAPTWLAAISLHVQSFHMLLLLTAASLLVSYAQSKRYIYLAVFGLLYGCGIVESVNFTALSPIFLFALIVVLWKKGTLSLTGVTRIGVLVVVGLSLYYFASKAFISSGAGAHFGYSKPLDVTVDVWKTQIKILSSGLPRVNWLMLLLFSAAPWLTAIFASHQGLNNERSWSQYSLHLALTAIVVMGLSNIAISPWGIMRVYGRLPVWAYAMLAMTAGYLAAYWYLLLKVTRPRRGTSSSSLVKIAGDWLGLVLTYPLIAFVVAASLLNAFECRGSRGAFADRCAGEILDRLGDRTWFVTDGTLDSHLAILARERGQELNLICLQKDLDKAYLAEMGELIETSQLFPENERQRMRNTLSLGILPFVQDWFTMDSEIEKKVAVFSVPDFWYTADLIPTPEHLFFGGRRDITALKEPEVLAGYEAFWQEMEGVLAPDRKGRTDPVSSLRAYLRRHMGFVANNLGVALEELDKPDEAFKVYTIVRDTIDPDNISVMFNRFEMARRGATAASASKDIIEKELKDFISNLKRQYPLWSLSRYYGYVRSPELFARLGWSWALSGQTGAALKGLRTASGLLTGSQAQASAMLTEAAIYNLAGERDKTMAIYQDLLKDDPSNRTAMLGLARIAVQEGAIDKARRWLEQAAQTDDKRGALGVEWATIHLMNNDLDQARLILQETTDLQPKNMQAWAMLAMVYLQQNDIDEIETVILPKMEKTIGTIDDYFIQITRAQMAQRKGKGFQRQARESYIRAAMLRPDIPGVKDAILQLDISMDDRRSAELHARQVLRANRKHALANYIMGSLRLEEGAYGEAEEFLRQSVETNPSAAALNDLAEVLRRIRKFDDAEKHARAACEISPDLYVAWETLASVLLDADRDLDEAEKAINKSLELFKDDLRIMITQARILLRKGEIERARETIHKLRSRQKELSPFDQEELAKLSEAASAKR